MQDRLDELSKNSDLKTRYLACYAKTLDDYVYNRKYTHKQKVLSDCISEILNIVNIERPQAVIEQILKQAIN